MNRLYSVAAVFVAWLFSACGGDGGAVYAPDVLVAVDNAVLSRGALARMMPSGLTPADSTALARAYIRQWIDEQLVERVAAADVDMDEIDRLTAEYRRQLIMAQYRRAMALKVSDGMFSADSVRSYFESHKDDFILERPLIKGVYLKVPENSKSLALMRRIYKSKKPADIDRLEKEAPEAAFHYDYFRDRWIELEQIETRIPVDFGSDELRLISSHQQLDVEAGGYVYLLDVDDYLPAGSPMPFEAAEPLVRERLLTLSRLDYDRQLRAALLAAAVENGTVVYPNQNPLK